MKTGFPRLKRFVKLSQIYQSSLHKKLIVIDMLNLMNGVTSNCLMTGSLSFGGREMYSTPDSISSRDGEEVADK